MADLVSINDSTNTPVSILTDEVTDAMLGTGHKQMIAVMDGTVNSTNKLVVNATGEASVVMNDQSASGALVTANSAITIAVNADAVAYVQATGTWVGSCVWEGTVDGTTWFTLGGFVQSTNQSASSFNGNGAWLVLTAGLSQVRVRRNVATSGTVNVSMRASVASNIARLVAGLPGGSNVIGQVQGSSAAGAAMSSSPLLVGGIGRTTNPTAIGDGTQSQFLTDKLGRLVTVLGSMREQVGKQATTVTSSTAATTVVNAGGASVYTDITHLSITNSSASPVVVTLSDGTVSLNFSVSAGGSLIQNFAPALPATTANTAWSLACSASVASVYCNVVYTRNL